MYIPQGPGKISNMSSGIGGILWQTVNTGLIPMFHILNIPQEPVQINNMSSGVGEYFFVTYSLEWVDPYVHVHSTRARKD